LDAAIPGQQNCINANSPASAVDRALLNLGLRYDIGKDAQQTAFARVARCCAGG